MNMRNKNTMQKVPVFWAPAGDTSFAFLFSWAGVFWESFKGLFLESVYIRK